MASPSGQGSCGDVGEALVTPKEEVIAPEDEPDQPSVGPGDAGSDSAAMNISGETDAANGSASESTVTAEESDPATSDQYPCSFVVVQRCVFCSATLTLSEKSKLLECLHAVCASCLLGWSEGCAADVVPAVPPKKLCPECQVTSRYNHLIDNKFLLEVGVLPSSINNNNSGGGGGGNNNNNGSGDSGSGGGGSGGGASSTESTDSSEIKCNNCPDVLATDWCDNCRDYICEACTTAHKQLACTKDHIIRPKDNIYIQKDRSGFENYPCPLHPKELLLLYCNSCGSLTCRDCQLSQFHRTHNYCFVDEIVDDAKNEMKALLNEVQYKSEIIDAAIGILDERTRKIAIKKSEILKEIKDIVTKLTELVSKTGKDLMFALNEACSTKLEVHRTHKKTLVAISKQAAHCTEFVKKALASSSNNCLLFSKHQILAHLNRIKGQKSQIPNPEFPIAIGLVTANMDSLVKVMTNFAVLKVDGHNYPSRPGQPSTPVSSQQGAVVQQQQQQQLQLAQHPQQQQQQLHHQQQPPGGSGATANPGATQALHHQQQPPPPPYQVAVSSQQPMAHGTVQQAQSQPQLHSMLGMPSQRTSGHASTVSQQMQQMQYARLQQQQQPQQQQLALPQQVAQQHNQQQQQQKPLQQLQQMYYTQQRYHGSSSSAGAVSGQAQHAQAVQPSSQQQQQQVQMRAIRQQPQVTSSTHPPPQQRQSSQVIMYGKQQYLAGATSSGDLSTAYAAAVGSGAGGYHAVTDGSAARGKSMHQQQPAAQLGHQQPSRNVQQQMYQRQLQQMNHTMARGGQQQQPQVPQHPQLVRQLSAVTTTRTSPSRCCLGRSSCHYCRDSSAEGGNYLKPVRTSELRARDDRPWVVSAGTYRSPNRPSHVSAKDLCQELERLQVIRVQLMSLKLKMASKRRNMFYANKKQETTEIGVVLLAPAAPSCAQSVDHLQRDSSFKIMLTKGATPPRTPTATPTVVTSSVPKTPSPGAAHIPGAQHKTEDEAASFDKYCRESISIFNNVMMTYSDFGVPTGSGNSAAGTPAQTRAPAPSSVPGQPPASSEHKVENTTPDSVVHSSTGLRTPTGSNESHGAGSGSSGETANDDPNDDWCAVCMDGGDLVCCDNCPKVFHAGCHIPSMATIPEDSWQCMLCQSLPQLTEVGTKRNSSGAPVGTNGRVRSMSDDERRVCERILLELYCQYDNSLVFRSPVPAENAEYFKKVHNPMSLDEVRARLSRNAPDNVKYASVREFIRDVRQVFRNAFNYFDINTKEYTDGMALEEFLETQLLKYLPRFAHSDIDQELSEHDEASVQSSDDDSEIVNGPTSAKKVRRIVD